MLAVDKIQVGAAQPGKGADILKWWTLMATDVITQLSFGESFEMLEQGKVRDDASGKGDIRTVDCHARALAVDLFLVRQHDCSDQRMQSCRPSDLQSVTGGLRQGKRVRPRQRPQAPAYRTSQIVGVPCIARA